MNKILTKIVINNNNPILKFKIIIHLSNNKIKKINKIWKIIHFNSKKIKTKTKIKIKTKTKILVVLIIIIIKTKVM